MEEFQNEFLQVIESRRAVVKDYLLANAYIIQQQRHNLLPLTQLALTEGQKVHVRNCLTYLEAAYEAGEENDDLEHEAFTSMVEWLQDQ